MNETGEDKMSCKITFHWDTEEAVWIATSEDVPGLVLESGSFDAFVERVKVAVPELINLKEHRGRFFVFIPK